MNTRFTLTPTEAEMIETAIDPMLDHAFELGREDDILPQVKDGVLILDDVVSFWIADLLYFLEVEFLGDEDAGEEEADPDTIRAIERVSDYLRNEVLAKMPGVEPDYLPDPEVSIGMIVFVNNAAGLPMPATVIEISNTYIPWCLYHLRFNDGEQFGLRRRAFSLTGEKK